MDAHLWISVAEVLVSLATLCGGAIFFCVGVYQYVRGQRWKKAEILLQLIQDFENDAAIRSVCQMIDWDERHIRLNQEKHIEFSNDLLIRALRVPRMDTATEFSPDEMIVRDCFDSFFDYFAKLEAFRKSQLLEFKDYIYFYYWFELLGRVGEYKENATIQSVIDKYMRNYNFIGMISLLQEYHALPASSKVKIILDE